MSSMIVWTIFASTLLISRNNLAVEGRAVNISNTWTLPQEGFPVFYRYFRDKISWIEADAVCQFHHGNLVTVDNGIQFDASRAFLKELDVTESVWIGLIRPQSSSRFMWTNSKPLDPNAGYWAESFPVIDSPLCATTDPVRDFRWHPSLCGGPVASFLCELPVPDWGAYCTISIPSVTIQYLTDTGTMQLTRDCGDEAEKHTFCKGKEDHDKILSELMCNEAGVTVPTNIKASVTTEHDENVSKVINKIVTEIQSINSDQTKNNELKTLDFGVKSEEKTNIDLIYQKKKNMVSKNVKYTPLNKKNHTPKDNKGRKHLEIEQEMMQGDDPLAASNSSTDTPLNAEFLPHVKRMLAQDLKQKDEKEGDNNTTTNIPLVTEERTRRETQILVETSDSTKEIQSTTETLTSTISQTTSDGSSNSTEDISFTTNYEELNLTESDAVLNNSIPTDLETTADTSSLDIATVLSQPHQKGSIIHPLHISSDMYKPANGGAKKKGDHQYGDHFVPPMLLVKAKFTASGKIFPEVYDPSLLESSTAIPVTEVVTDLPISADNTTHNPNTTNGITSTTMDISKFYPASTEKQHLENEIVPTKQISTTQEDSSNLTTTTTVETTSFKLPITTTTSEKLEESIQNSEVEPIEPKPLDLEEGAVNDLQIEKTSNIHPLHAEYENSFSNIENYKPYRPNRRRALTKPAETLYLKKILG